ncbi:MAG TPA: FHA domain-containing protein [Chloroflexi bacterium]|nr:FHA domain-containing protein [Chloroflexota bacterium]
MKKRNHLSCLFRTFLLSLILLSGTSGASAQSEKSVHISIPDTSAYPIITVYIDPLDRDGNRLENLQLDQITLLEDSINRDLLEIQALNPGIQLVTALNLSSPFAIQDINRRSRFDYIKESLLNWAAQSLDTAPDDLSIIDSLGLELIHTEKKSDWVKALEELDPDLREIESNFNVLARAIEIASDPVPQPGMKKVVLFFSPQPSSDGFEPIDNLISLAKDNQVQVYTVLVSSPAYFETAGAAKLQTLSEETGGEYLTFSGAESLLDIGQLLAPLRTTYLLRYQSSIVTSGTHTLEVSIASTPSKIEGLREFTLDVQPPNPIFITPPQTITRTPLEESLEDSVTASFEPTSISLPILVEFPDHHPRELEELIFRVDGEIFESKTTPPYDHFIWDLDRYQISGTHYLTLEAVDKMGLSRLSVETPIRVEVILPIQDTWDIARKNSSAMLGLALILLLGLTFIGLIRQGKIHPGNNRVSSQIKNLGSRSVGTYRKLFHFFNRPPLPAENMEFSPYRLIPVSDLSQQLFTEPLQINDPVITLGNSAREDVIRIQHPSITADHARISLQKENQYQITDLGSIAGTWINYQQIAPASPHILKDGDIINIGEAAFRFQIKNRPNSQAAHEENSH